MFCTSTLVLFEVCALCPIWLIVCGVFISCYSGTLLSYSVNDFEIVPLALHITGVTFVFTFHIPHALYLYFYLYFRIFSVFPEHIFAFWICDIFNIHVPLSLSRIMMSGLLLGTALSVCSFWFLWLPYFYDLFILVLIEALPMLTNFTPIPSYTLNCSWTHILSCLLV